MGPCQLQPVTKSRAKVRSAALSSYRILLKLLPTDSEKTSLLTAEAGVGEEAKASLPLGSGR